MSEDVEIIGCSPTTGFQPDGYLTVAGRDCVSRRNLKGLTRGRERAFFYRSKGGGEDLAGI